MEEEEEKTAPSEEDNTLNIEVYEEIKTIDKVGT